MTLPSPSRAFPGDRIWRLFLIAAVLGAGLRWQPARAVARFTSSAVEEATPDSHVPVSPASPAVQRQHHLAALGVDRWHQAGFQGQGVKIAILDSGFRGFKHFLGTALPQRILTASWRKDSNLEARDSQHGVLCGEVLHALAPRAELLLANWEPDHPDSFLQAVEWARQQGARIISCSLIMPSWSDGEGGGPTHANLARLVGKGDLPNDMLFFASAGNIALRHWSGSFRPDHQGLHQWQAGKTSNGLRPWGQERLAVELYGPLGRGLELQVLDKPTGEVVGRATAFPPPAQGRAPAAKKTAPESRCAVVRFLPHPGRAYEVRLRQFGPARTMPENPFHLVVLGGYLERATSAGSIPFPGDGACVQAVGAVDEEGKRLFYSSCGPNSNHPKPDFVAPVPFPSLCRERAFSGTSAAAPQAAALAALWWSRHPGWTAHQVCEALRSTARDLGPSGHDWETGFGAIHLP